jgi:hypothetical protein
MATFPFKLAVLAISCAALAGCDQDPFGLSCRPISGKFCLEQWEDGQTYYLSTGNGIEGYDDAIGGTVESIGWKGNYIAVLRKSNFGGEPTAWVVVDTRTGKIQPPVSSLPSQFANLRPMTPSAAWAALSR